MFRSSRRLLAVLGTTMVGILAATLLSSTSQAGTPAAESLRPRHPDAGSGKPTVVMVHGAWADSSGWYDSAEMLRARGFDVIALANPLRGLTSDAAYIRSALETIDGPIVLVAHSYGGAVITGAATGLPNIEALVYVAAFVPDEGEPVGALNELNPGSLITEQALDRPPVLDRRRGWRRPLHPPRDLPRGLRRRPAGTHGPPHADDPASALRGRTGRAVRRPGVEDDPVLVPLGDPGPDDPARHPGVHGDACESTIDEGAARHTSRCSPTREATTALVLAAVRRAMRTPLQLTPRSSHDAPPPTREEADARARLQGPVRRWRRGGTNRTSPIGAWR